MNEFPVPLRGAKSTTLMWAHEHTIDSSALHQLRSIAALEWTHGIRVMADVHMGSGAAVGSVIAMPSAISPSAVGGDIGCGVSAVRTNLMESDLDDLHGLRMAVERRVPVGSGQHSEAIRVKRLGLDRGWDAFWGRFRDLNSGVRKAEGRAQKEMATLGNGNHFLELCGDAEGRIWLTLHSGSRTIGKELASRHIDIAKSLPHNADLRNPELAVFVRDTPEMKAYRHDLEWAQEYAMRSRAGMMALFKQEVSAHFDAIGVKYDSPLSVHHNYVAEEEIDGRMMFVTRKGAVRARAGELVLIPGSMGTGSYIGRGLGNPASFQSTSHGAGRKMTRGEAKEAFLGDDLGASAIAAQLGDIEVRRDQGIVDELPLAYKNIESVMEAQSDLVEVVQHLRTLMCVKG